jgi:hypothetical protein
MASHMVANGLGSIDLVNGIFGAGSSVALTALGVAIRWAIIRFRLRRVRHFWKPIMSEPLTIVLTEYMVRQTVAEEAEIAQAAGAGWLITKGSALALGELRDFAKKYLRLPVPLSVRGDRSGVIETENFIVIGSEANNRVAETAMNLIRENYEAPLDFRWNEIYGLVEIHLADNRILRPNTKDGFGVDYAAVVKAKIPGVRSRTILLISGCHMWGSHAAAEAVTSPALLGIVAKMTGDSDSVAFIVRTHVVNGAGTGPELTFEGRAIAMALQVVGP